MRRGAGPIVWNVPGKSVSVHLNHSVVTAMECFLEGAEGPARPQEHGGILLGRVRSVNEGFLVAVEELIEVPCEHVRGASWTLSRSDRRELDRMLKGRNVVGWFRTHSRPGLYLDQHDYELFTDYFAHPAAVSLIVRPDREASFFFWEDGEIQRSKPYSTFLLETPEGAEEPVASPAAKVIEMPRRTPSRVRVSVPRLGRKALLTGSVAAGLAAGMLWNPSIERSLEAAAVEVETERPQRPVFEAAAEVPEPAVLRPAVAVAETPARTAPKKMVVPATFTKAAPGAQAVQEGKAPRVKKAADTVHRATATVEEARPSALRRGLGAIPGLGFMKRKKQPEGFVAPAAVAQVQPRSPESLREDVPVRVKILVDESGRVLSTELLSRGVSRQVAASALEAARGWRFKPAKMDAKPVRAETILSFTFPATTVSSGI